MVNEAVGQRGGDGVVAEDLARRPEERVGLPVNPAVGDGNVLRLYDTMAWVLELCPPPRNARSWPGDFRISPYE
jgi:hypothetical protein